MSAKPFGKKVSQVMAGSFLFLYILTSSSTLGIKYKSLLEIQMKSWHSASFMKYICDACLLV
tara:strand:+ start:448 stop:633 length:186 start_codon:yes stop_codon:yes gene_type:complete